MSAERDDPPRRQAPLAELERALIEEYVRMRGYDPAKLGDLPDEQRRAILKEASIHASSKLTEVESRSRYLDEIHDGVPGTHKTGLD